MAIELNEKAKIRKLLKLSPQWELVEHRPRKRVLERLKHSKIHSIKDETMNFLKTIFLNKPIIKKDNYEVYCLVYDNGTPALIWVDSLFPGISRVKVRSKSMMDCISLLTYLSEKCENQFKNIEGD